MMETEDEADPDSDHELMSLGEVVAQIVAEQATGTRSCPPTTGAATVANVVTVPADPPAPGNPTRESAS
jgi:hypothetical protein